MFLLWFSARALRSGSRVYKPGQLGTTRMSAVRSLRCLGVVLGSIAALVTRAATRIYCRAPPFRLLRLIPRSMLQDYEYSSIASKSYLPCYNCAYRIIMNKTVT